MIKFNAKEKLNLLKELLVDNVDENKLTQIYNCSQEDINELKKEVYNSARFILKEVFDEKQKETEILSDLKILIQNNIFIFSFGDTIDLYNSVVFKNYILNRVEKEKITNIIINCQGITYIDSSGIDLFISLFLKMKKNGMLRFCNVDEGIMKRLQMLRLDEVFNIDIDLAQSKAKC